MAEVTLDASRAPAETAERETVVIAQVEVTRGKSAIKLGVSETDGAPQSRALVRYSVKRDKWTRSASLRDIADAMDAGLIG